MARIAAKLELAGYWTFLPQRDGLERYLLPLLDGAWARAPGSRAAGERLGRAVFDLDVYQLVERCRALVINLNGRVPDEGAVAEAAIAFAVGRPVIMVKDDRRAPFSGLDNSMVSGLSAVGPIRRIDQLVGEVA